MKNARIIDPIMIARKKELITQIFEKYFLYLQSLSARNSRVQKKDDDIQDFFLKLCKMDIEKLEEILHKKEIAFIRRAYINNMISIIRREGKNNHIPIINEITRDEQMITDIYEFITREEIQMYKEMIARRFRQADKYIKVFEMMIEGCSNKEIIEETGLLSSTVGTIKSRIADFLKSNIIGA